MSVLCKLGIHNFKSDDTVFYINHPFACFSQTCSRCGQKSLLRCWHFGWAGKEKKRELVKTYKGYECHTIR